MISKLLGDKLVAKKKNEKFKRIKGSTLAKMLQEPTSNESIFNLAGQYESLQNVPSLLTVAARTDPFYGQWVSKRLR